MNGNGKDRKILKGKKERMEEWKDAICIRGKGNM